MSDAAIANIVTGAVTITVSLVGFLTLWVKLRYAATKSEEAATRAEETANKVEIKAADVERKIDNNTKLTIAGADQASSNAMVAAQAATIAADKSAEIMSQLNGKLDERIIRIVDQHVKPVVATIRAHAEQDDKNMAEIRTTLEEIKKIVHSTKP